MSDRGGNLQKIVFHRGILFGFLLMSAFGGEESRRFSRLQHEEFINGLCCAAPGVPDYRLSKTRLPFTRRE